MSSFYAVVRSAIYSSVVEHHVAPSIDAVARALGASIADTEEAFRALADGHVIVLYPGTLDIVWAPPFAAVPTPFRSRVDHGAWSAPCAWDAFGIPAALKKSDATIEAQCAWSGEELDCGIERGRAYGGAVIHLLVAAAHFWDDIFFT